MAVVSITIPDAFVSRLTTAARATFPQYAALTPTQLFQAATSDYWKMVLANAEYAAAQNAAIVTSQAIYDKALADGSGIG